jgi:hypothetical protein
VSLSITHVAIRFNGEIYSLPAPNRHHDVIRHICKTTGATHVDAYGDDQGFLDSEGHYRERRFALNVARAAGQLDKVRPKTNPSNLLFSEDIW